MGGAVAAIENGYQKSEIEHSAYRVQQETDSGDRTVVGVNRFQSNDQPIDLLQIDESAAGLQQKKTGRPSPQAG
jgi:methylmalonyl-CoA mutase N-terminal domain/subunit